MFFFFQAEDGIRDYKVTGVQTCALPIFLAMLSHELRTPLTPVLASALALESEPDLPKDIHESLQMIRRNVELEARLIDDLLDLTRIDRGKVQLNFEVVRSEEHTSELQS